MTISQGSWCDILTVLRQTHAIWSAGLSKYDYREYIWRQMTHQWGLKNHQFYVMKVKGEVVSSCKLYTVQLNSGTRTFKLAGLGAIYTGLAHRHRGYAVKMIDALIDLCHDNNYDGMLLYSDIEPLFYEKLGFIPFGAADFTFDLPWHLPQQAPEAVTNYFERHHIPAMAAIYAKWQRRQPFAFARCEGYFDYKFLKERFLADHSHLGWPKLQIRFAQGQGGSESAYALSETGGSVLRILEVVGSDCGRQQLWSTIFEEAYNQQIHKVRAWEAVAADMAPGYKLASLVTAESKIASPLPAVHYYERDWGRLMILPFTRELESWPEYFPCPILELDHL